MLNFLHKGEPFGARIILDLEIDQEVFGGRMPDQLMDDMGIEFQVLRGGLAAIDDGRNATSFAELLGSRTAAHGAGNSVQWYRFHVLNQHWGQTP